MEEAARCLNCKNAKCVAGCPVSINIPAFIHEVKEGNFEAAYQIISESSALPAVCGRVCPQETQCEGKCCLLYTSFSDFFTAWFLKLQRERITGSCGSKCRNSQAEELLQYQPECVIL